MSSFDIVTVVASIATIGGLVFAILSHWRAAKQAREIAEQIATRPIGQFPDFMPDLSELVSSAKRSLYIMCDFPRYGYFSAYKSAQTILKALREKKTTHEVSIVVLDYDVGEDILRKQLKARWENINNDTDPYTARFKANLQAFNIQFDRTIDSLDSFCENVIRDQKEIVDSAEYPKMLRVSTRLPLHCWIADGRRAIFSIPGDLAWTEYAFRTEDPKLIEALISVHQKLLDSAK